MKVIWWCQFGYSKEWTPDSIKKIWMSCKNQVYIQIGLTNSMWGFLTISDNPNWGGGGYTINFGALIRSCINFVLGGLLTRYNHKKQLKKRLFTTIEWRFDSKLFINDSNSSWDWLGEWFNEIKSHSLSLILIWKLMHSIKKWRFFTFNRREILW